MAHGLSAVNSRTSQRALGMPNRHRFRKLLRRSGIEVLEDRRLLTSWQNSVNRLDVNASGDVTVLDALVVINSLRAGRARELTGDPSTSDPYRYVDVNGDHRRSPLDALLVINAISRHSRPLNLVISAAPEADPNGNGVVLDSSIELHGQTSALAHVLLTITALDVEFKEVAGRQRTVELLADDTGKFAVHQDLYFGLNRLSAKVADVWGHETVVEQEITAGDVVSDWNAAMLNVVRDWTGTSNDPYEGRIVPSQPPLVARNLALIQVVMFDVLNRFEGTYTPYLTMDPPAPDTSSIAAAASAAYEVARVLYTGAKEKSAFDATLAESLARVPDGPAKDRGIAYGKISAAAMLQSRASDGVPGVGNYLPDNTPGKWNRTAPDNLPPLLAGWGNVRPLASDDITVYRPAAPPALTSPTYAEAVDQVMNWGGLNSATRTADQTEIALFWADGGGTATPPGHWNQIATQVSLAAHETTLERARTLALLNLAMADAGIAAWDAKYVYDLWRPIDAIHRASEDGNPATVADAEWFPLLRTPPFPTYTSGHSTFSGAAAEVLTTLYGDNVSLASRSDGHMGLTQRPLASIFTRHFENFWAAAEEAGMSRIYGGIHFQFDNTAGLVAGSAIAGDVVAKWLHPVA